MPTVTHTFVSGIADNPQAAAAGEVLPSHWNAVHTVSGVRTTLAANVSYFVSATGSDSNGGTNSSTDAWATIQHAVSFIAANIDFGANTVTINIGAGTFTGFGLPSFIGGGNCLIYGAGSALTTIINGPNDGLLNGGEPFSVFVPNSTIIFANGFTLAFNHTLPNIVSASFDVFAPVNVNFYHTPDFVADVKIDFTNVDSGHTGIWIDFPGGVIADNGWSIIGGGATVFAALLVENNSVYGLGQTGNTWTITGSLTCSQAFAQADTGGKIDPITLTPMSGAGVTGKRFNLIGSGSIQSQNGPNTLGPNFFPGNAAGTSDGSSAYDGYFGVTAKSGLPASTDLSAGMQGVFKDTSGGGVYLAYNDAGTIKKVALV